ncbi:uncharacterized protein LOC112589084 [Harpegnathos saltator]|uniref:uncharacterized protein LOC112589084 n=1 Tax=Harpegnathos saltator TaxID=610380 RepID=UPI000DBEDE6F|nr:uncharacterized protein LOC112589084 [Harpegnathos saltator]
MTGVTEYILHRPGSQARQTFARSPMYESTNPANTPTRDAFDEHWTKWRASLPRDSDATVLSTPAPRRYTHFGSWLFVRVRDTVVDRRRIQRGAPPPLAACLPTSRCDATRYGGGERTGSSTSETTPLSA